MDFVNLNHLVTKRYKEGLYEKQSWEDYQLALDSCQPFVYWSQGNGENAVNIPDKVDLPFEVCSFELNGDNCIEVGFQDTEEALMIRSILCIDLGSDKKTSYWISIGNGSEMTLASTDAMPEGEGKDSMYDCINGVVQHLLTQMVAKSYIEGKQTCRKRFKTNLGARRLNSVIHISPKNKIKAINDSTSYRVDFTHRFLRRGHWRKLNAHQIGKNRDGNRSERGRTWVNHCEVGASDLPLIKKTRLIK
jgi:hypothetical protein